MTEAEQETADERGIFRRVHDRLHSNPVTGAITKIVITLVGVAVMAVGVFLSGPGIPGPGFLVIIGGLAILATEYDWAQRVLEWARERYERAKAKVRDMDPAERRRRLVLTAGAVLLVVAGVVGYVAAYDWPHFAVDSWNWVQDINGAVPELPGM